MGAFQPTIQSFDGKLMEKGEAVKGNIPIFCHSGSRLWALWIGETTDATGKRCFCRGKRRRLGL
jgi:hypothetical protein